MIVAGSHLYDHCRDCGKLVRINKPLFGSLHLCLTDEERAARRRQQISAPPQQPLPTER